MINTDISIYVPVYNGEKTLERCINSVEYNMYPKIISGTEPIVINFNSL